MERRVTSSSRLPACWRPAHCYARLRGRHLGPLRRDKRLRSSVDHFVLRRQLARQSLHGWIETMRTEQRDLLASAFGWPIAEEERALADSVLFVIDKLAHTDDMQSGVKAVGELLAIGNDRHNDGAWRFSPRQALSRLDDPVEERHAAPRHREQPANS